MKMFKFEMKRSIYRIEFYTIMLVEVLIISANQYLYRTKMYNINSTVINAWVGTDYQFVCCTLFYTLMPLFAVMPCAASYYKDLETGYIKNLCIKASRRQYYVAKAVTAFVVSSITVIFPLALDLFISMGLYPSRTPEPLLFLAVNPTELQLFDDVYQYSTIWYCVVYILIDGLFAGLFSLICICIAERCESVFACLVFPFIMLTSASVYLSNDIKGSETKAILDMICPNQSYFAKLSVLALWFFFLFTIPVAWIYFKGRRKDVI